MSRSDVTLRCHAGGHTRRDPVGYATDQDFFENDQIFSRFQKLFRQSIPLAKLRRSAKEFSKTNIFLVGLRKNTLFGAELQVDSF